MELNEKAPASVVFVDNAGIRYEIKTGVTNAMVDMTLETDDTGPHASTRRLNITNKSKDTIYIEEAAVLDMEETDRILLPFNGPISQWTIQTADIEGRVVELGVEWHESLKTHYSSHDYALLGNHANKQYLMLGFLTFAKQDSMIELNMSAPPPKFNRLKAVCKFGRYPLAPGESVATETLYMNDSNDLSKVTSSYVDELLSDRTPRPIRDKVVGWATWDYYLQDISLDDVIENMEWLATHKDIVPVEYVQIDHGFEIREGDWLDTNEHFPGGLERLSHEISSRGFSPGIWLCPFLLAPNSRTYAEHPDWAIKDTNGNPLEVNGYAVKTVYALDCSIPEACEWLTELGRTITQDLGFKYVKLDGANDQTMSPAGVISNSRMTKGEAMLEGLRAFRTGMSDDAFLLNACQFGSSIGIADGMRVGQDVGGRWDGSRIDKHHGERDNFPGPGEVRRAIMSTANNHYLHRRLWVNDPDYLVVRQKGCKSDLSLEEARSWASMVALCNGVTMLADKLPALSEDRVDLLARTVPPAGSSAVPVDFFAKPVPTIYHTRHETAWDTWDLVLVINADRPERNRDYTLNFKQLGIDNTEPLHVFDFWSSRYLGTHAEGFKIENLPSRSCRVLRLTRTRNEPCLVGTDIHVSQGQLEIESMHYDRETHSLHVKPSPCNKHGKLYVQAPEACGAPENATQVEPGIFSIPVKCDGNELILKFTV